MNISNIFGGKNKSIELGIDIGTTAIKVVEVERIAGAQPRLLNYGMLETQSALLRANTALQTSTLKIFERDIADYLKALISSINPKAKTAVASLPSFSAFTTIISIPEVDPKELEQTVIYQARQVIPSAINEVALDWSKVGEYTDANGNKFFQIFLVSVPQEQIKKYQRIFSDAGLTLRALEVESVSLMRSLIANDPTPTYVVDIGSLSTGILISEGGQLRFSGQTDFSGSSLTQALATSLNINPLRAEELKRERGIIGTGANYELSTIMLPFLDAIISEVRRAEFSYKTQFPDARNIERMILSGGGSNLLGIEKYFRDQFKIPVVKAAPFSKFSYPVNLEPLVPELSSYLSVAMGLALK